MARGHPQMPRQSRISGCYPVPRNTGLPESLKFFKGDFSIQAQLLLVGHLSFPQFDLRNAKTADV
jgi:hypothetical protein